MKRLSLIFSILVVGVLAVVMIFDIDAAHQNENSYINDLSTDGGLLFDMVFDAEGNLLVSRTYNWDEDTNSRGSLVAEYDANTVFIARNNK